ncbi:aldo/keto reductase [Micromonospora sp. DT81.3]|uniref:aldo/keto reductase n=1 Tax=Micromonospora sp. DT81.3 TaxID=3416523 RepID=UPI003CF7F44F
MESITLNSGARMPQLGIGVYQVRSADCGPALASAFAAGYRSVDTANAYLNERAVGEAIRNSGLPREDVFLTSKLWPPNYPYEKAVAAIDGTLRRLATDYIDLLLLHQQYGDYNGAWRAMEEAVEAGKVRALGVSNFDERRFTDLTVHASIVPAVNQVECHPYHQQRELKGFLRSFGTVLEAWYPLGHADRRLLAEPVFAELARKHGKSPVQVILRWHIQEGNIAIPRSTNPSHIAANIDIFDFVLAPEEVASIGALDKGKPFFQMPDLLGRILLPAARINFDKRQR